MDDRNERKVLDVIDVLYTMVTEAWGVPLGNERCILERDKVLSLLDEIKEKLPVEMAEAKRIVTSKEHYIGGAKKDADAIRRSAEERARELINEQEVVKAADRRAREILSEAQTRTRELYRVANAYVDDQLKRTEDAIGAALQEVHSSRSAFRKAAANLVQNAQRTSPEPDGAPIRRQGPQDEQMRS